MDKSQVVFRPPLGLREISVNPWEVLAVNILGPVLDNKGVPKYFGPDSQNKLK